MATAKTILVVDDDPGTRRLLQFVLAKTGCEIITSSNGAEALAIASEKTIDLLVTDLMMDGMDGFSLSSSLQKMPAYAKLPIILLSARFQIEYRNEVWDCDSLVLMNKPFSPIELIAQIKLLLKL